MDLEKTILSLQERLHAFLQKYTFVIASSQEELDSLSDDENETKIVLKLYDE